MASRNLPIASAVAAALMTAAAGGAHAQELQGPATTACAPGQPCESAPATATPRTAASPEATPPPSVSACSAAQASICGPAEQCDIRANLYRDPRTFIALRSEYDETKESWPICFAEPAPGLRAVYCGDRAPPSVSTCHFELSGRITHRLVDAFEAFLESAVTGDDQEGFNFYVSSDGGNLDAAMRLGSILRRRSADVIVKGNAQCAGACLLVLAGGVERHLIGPVIAQDPGEADTGQSVNGGRGAWSEAQRIKLTEYLSEMGVSLALVDVISTARPERAGALTAEQLSAYGLSEPARALDVETGIRTGQL